jgi:hypothetical protein
MKTSISIIFLFFFFSISYSQTDQELIYGTYFGGENVDIIYDITLDQNGNTFLVGRTQSETGIATSGAYQEYLNGIGDGFIVKFDSGYNLVWSTYFGGEGIEEIFGVAVLSDGSIVITGVTASEFDISTPGAFQEEFGGDNDFFIANFSNDGDLIWSTYYGKESGDKGQAIVIDNNDNILIAGVSGSDNMATSGVYQENRGGGTDGLIVKFSNGGTLLWASYYGGENLDVFTDLGLNNQNELCLLGFTSSENNIASENAYQETYNGTIDCFITKFTLSGERVWGTYYGGPGFEQAYGIDSDDNGNIIVSGYTSSATGIATPDAHKTIIQLDDDFLASFTPDGQINWGTYVGGERNEKHGNDIIIKDNDIYFASRTDSENGIVSGSPYQEEFSAPNEPEFYTPDIYLVKFSNSGEQLWGTYYGGLGFDIVDKIIFLDENTIALAAVSGGSGTTITTPDAYQPEDAGFVDGLFAVFDVDLLTGINEIEKSDLMVFPNPASAYFIIGLPETINTSGLVEIYSLEGKRMAVFENYIAGNRIPIDLLSGMYLVNYRAGELNLRTKLLVD